MALSTACPPACRRGKGTQDISIRMLKAITLGKWRLFVLEYFISELCCSNETHHCHIIIIYLHLRAAQFDMGKALLWKN